MENIINDKLFNEAQKRIQNLVNSNIDQNTVIELYNNLTPSNAKDTIDIINGMCYSSKKSFNYSLFKVTGSIFLIGAGFFGLTCLIEKRFSLKNKIYIEYSKKIAGLLMIIGLVGILSIGH